MEASLSPASQLVLDTVTTPEAHQQWEQLLNQAFNVPAGVSFLDDFPVWHQDRSPLFTLKMGVFDHGQLASAAGVRLCHIKIGGRNLLPAAIIGGVVTDPAHRGRGYASKIVTLALNWAEEHGARAAFLWSSDPSLYERIGFRQVGRQLRVPLKDLNLSEPIVYQEGWVPSLFECLQNRPVGLQLTSLDEKWVSAHRNVRWFWVGDAAAPRAYAALGKGIDLPGLVHEWGGDPYALRGLLASIRSQEPEAALLTSPDLLKRSLFAPKQELQASETVCLACPLVSEADADPIPENLWLWGIDGA